MSKEDKDLHKQMEHDLKGLLTLVRKGAVGSLVIGYARELEGLPGAMGHTIALGKEKVVNHLIGLLVKEMEQRGNEDGQEPGSSEDNP